MVERRWCAWPRPMFYFSSSILTTFSLLCLNCFKNWPTTSRIDFSLKSIWVLFPFLSALSYILMLILTSLLPNPKPILKLSWNLATFYTSLNAEPLRANSSLLTSPSCILYSEPCLLLPLSPCVCHDLCSFLLQRAIASSFQFLPFSASWYPMNPPKILVYYMIFDYL